MCLHAHCNVLHIALSEELRLAMRYRWDLWRWRELEVVSRLLAAFVQAALLISLVEEGFGGGQQVVGGALLFVQSWLVGTVS